MDDHFTGPCFPCQKVSAEHAVVTLFDLYVSGGSPTESSPPAIDIY